MRRSRASEANQVRLVIDSNALRSDDLRRYLSQSPRNEAVLTDYAAMEAYKGDTLVAIPKSMAVLGDFPKQVIILRGTQAVCGLSGRGRGLQRRLIDERQTADFERFCKALGAAKSGHQALQRQLLELGRDAAAHMQRMLIDSRDTGQAIDDIGTTFTPEERRILRERFAVTEPMFRKLIENVARIARNLFGSHPAVRKWPNPNEIANTFIFRSALCGYLLALDWISLGGAAGAKPERLRNDMVDINFAAYATYFDGLMSADKRVMRIYEEAKLLLDMIFRTR